MRNRDAPLLVVGWAVFACGCADATGTAQTEKFVATEPAPGVAMARKVADLKQTEYVSFQGEKLERYVWIGKHCAFLTESAERDPVVMKKLTDTFDKVYEYYHEATGRKPHPVKQHEGRITIAEVTNTCGAGCGMLGATGIELIPACFGELYDGVAAKNEYDQALPYEFGRNFWFYRAQLAQANDKPDDAYASSIITGYAVFMRFMSLDAAGVELGSFRGESGKEFRRQVEELVDLYVADTSLNLENTLKIGAAPANPMGLGSTDLFASFCFRLARDYGGRDYISRLWKEAEKRPEVQSTQDAIDNFVIAASLAAEEDLSPLFIKTWRWPVSETAKTELRSKFDGG